MNDYIGISEDRLHHILGVARKCYKIAKQRGMSDEVCNYMFLLGWLHDVGYEFSKTQEEHSSISLQMVEDFLRIGLENSPRKSNRQLIKEFVTGNRISHLIFETSEAISKHGSYAKFPERNESWEILNIADLTIDSKGYEVDVMQRLDDIKNRYGERSNQYLTACDIAVQVGLITRESVNRDQFGG